MKKDNEFENIKDKVIQVLKENKVKKAGIFGSYARGDQNKESDVDILIELDRNVGLLELIGLKLLLEKQIQRKIDLVEYEAIREEFRDEILKEEIPLIR